MSGGQGKRITIDDDELSLLIYGQRRLATKLRQDVRYFERSGKPEGLTFDAGRQLVQCERLHDRLMQIATARGVTVGTNRQPS